MFCVENAYLYIKRPGEAQDEATKNRDKETLESNSRELDVPFDAQGYHDWLEEKVKLSVYIPRWLRHSLIQYIERKYGGDVPHGAISEAVTELLAKALETHAPAQSTGRELDRLSKIRATCEEIMTELKRRLPDLRPGSIVGYGLLARVIADLRGRKRAKDGKKMADRRTIRRWLDMLKKLKFIAETSGGSFVIVWVPEDVVSYQDMARAALEAILTG